MTKEQFIDEIAKYAHKYAPQFGIKIVSPVIAQACLESGYGTSSKAKYNNYFGLKYRPGRVSCNNGYITDDGTEQEPNGQYKPIVTDWYTFPDMEAGVLGYFQFTSASWYSSIKGITDPYQYLVNIKLIGYATDQDYVKKAWYILQNESLTRYDDYFEPSEKSKYKVAIDAGHGSNTAGKRTPDGYREHWINVATASFCDTALRRCGIDVLRVAWDDGNAKDDEDLALAARQKIIKNSGCIVSISFHANAYGSGWNDAQGVETLISNKAPGDSLKLAKLAQSYLIKGTPQKNRGVKTQSLAMCNCNTMGTKAAILVEIGFMTNRAEADLMRTDAFCKEQAEEVAHAVCDYLGVKYTAPSESVIQTIVENTKPAASASDPYLVRINTDVLNVRSGPGTSYSKTTTVKRGQVYTIVGESGGWGRLKSGAGWISLSYTVRI
ncbi:MAG: N-acetylmuramoyl-L-alanine amidase [Lachnospiraceae bacterium]|nr:N-acetylmuramoyl-L-alanine amidase [Lachnospiraceae bacterium]